VGTYLLAKNAETRVVVASVIALYLFHCCIYRRSTETSRRHIHFRDIVYRSIELIKGLWRYSVVAITTDSDSWWDFPLTQVRTLVVPFPLFLFPFFHLTHGSDIDVTGYISDLLMQGVSFCWRIQ
jgi:hypothetical protein